MKKIIIGTKFFDKYDWGCFVEGYREATKSVLNHIKESGERVNQNMILPGLFLFRHFMELIFKEIIHHNDIIFGNENQKYIHDLKKLWNATKKEITKYYREYPSSFENNEYLNNTQVKLNQIGKIVDYFSKMDNNSFSFRYPRNKKNEQILPEEFKIDMDDLKRDFKTVELFLTNFVVIQMLNDKNK